MDLQLSSSTQAPIDAVNPSIGAHLEVNSTSEECSRTDGSREQLNHSRPSTPTAAGSSSDRTLKWMNRIDSAWPAGWKTDIDKLLTGSTKMNSHHRSSTSTSRSSLHPYHERAAESMSERIIIPISMRQPLAQIADLMIPPDLARVEKSYVSGEYKVDGLGRRVY